MTDTVAARFSAGLYAPAGFAVEPAAVDRAAALLRARGHKVTIDPTCERRHERFAGDDAERLAAVMRMACDPEVEVAIAVRGGYGWSRLLGQLDFQAIASARKRWLGHSDFTAFQLAALAHAGMVTYAGPMAAYDLGAEAPVESTLTHCFRMLETGEDTLDCTFDGPDFAGEGTLWGGNLAMVAHLVGTAHFPDTHGGLLFLEDIGETGYRIERMLYQLHYAGVLAKQRAVLLGTFNGLEPMPTDNGYALASVIEHARSHFGVPVFTGFPFGHIPEKVTVPVGGQGRLRVRDGRARLEMRARVT